jgi:hypothetical protein
MCEKASKFNVKEVDVKLQDLSKETENEINDMKHELATFQHK